MAVCGLRAARQNRGMEESGVATTVDRYVFAEQRYRQLLHGNVLDMEQGERAGFGSALASDAVQVMDAEIELLLDGDWRAQITGAWLIGLGRRVRHRERVRDLLLASKLVFAGQGFCFALARFGTYEDARALVDYLDLYLQRPDLQYDQPWALGALLCLDGRHGTYEASRFLGEGGAWYTW